MFDEMMGKCDVSKKFINALIDQPVLGSIFIVDFFLVFFIKTHWSFTILMVGGLVAISMYYGQKLALFKIPETAQTEPAVQAEKAG